MQTCHTIILGSFIITKRNTVDKIQLEETQYE